MQHQTTLQLEPEPKLDDNVVQLGDENEEKWLDALKELKQAKEISLDLETYGEENEQDGLNPWRGKVRLMQIGLPSGLVIVVDFGSPFHDRASRWKLIKTRLMPILRPILESRNVLKLFHNGKFDMLYLLVQFGIRVRRVFDSMLASQLIRAGLQSKGLHTLKRVANDFLGIEVDKQQQNSSWSAPNLSNAQINYGAEDARVLHPLKQKLKERLQQDRLIRQAKIEMNALPAIVEMIYNGVPVDVSEVDEAIEKYENCRQDILKPFYEAFGENANPDMDPNQLVELAREKLGVDISSTKKDELAFHKGVPALRALGLARSLKKQIDQLETIKEAEHNGRVCGDIVQIAPKGFGRITCKKGAIGGMILQQIPKPLTDPEIKP
ncbi:MAG: hypothetical protein ABEI54_03890, partial [Candidatus Bipolaricaulia bacterium]